MRECGERIKDRQCIADKTYEERLACMENLNSWLVIVVFGLGSVVGGLLVTLQRQCAMERIRHEFEQELAAVLRQTGGDRPAAGVEAVRQAHASPTQTTDEMAGEAEEEMDSWERAFVPAGSGSSHTHAGV